MKLCLAARLSLVYHNVCSALLSGYAGTLKARRHGQREAIVKCRTCNRSNGAIHAR